MSARRPLDGNHKMDSFFDSYVYGTALPNYKLETSYDTAPERTILNVKLTQSNVDDKFKMIVPICLELTTGKVVKLGAARIVGTPLKKNPARHAQRQTEER